MAVKRTIARSAFDDDARRWALGGMAANMFAWLETLANGSENYLGYQLAGTLDPRDPDPTKFQAPPKWLTPDVLMDAVCAWQAGSAQDYLFANGLVPLVRARVAADGTAEVVSGADVEVAIGALAAGYGSAYYLLVNQETAPYPLGDLSTISITQSAALADVVEGTATPTPAIVARIVSGEASGSQVLSLVDSGLIPFSRFSGWAWTFEGGAAASAEVHVFV